MRYLYFILVLTFFSCGGDKNSIAETNEKEEVYTVEIPIDESQIEGKVGEEEMSRNYTQILSCRIGLYEQQCMMILNFSPSEKVGVESISGEYFYAKHQKKLDLEGERNIKNNIICLTESYKGKQSGYMEFNEVDNNFKNFWTTSKSDKNHQFLSAEVLGQFSDESEEVEIRHERYENTHEIYSNTEIEERLTATDYLNISWVGGLFMAFDYHVINYNQNLGSLDGVANVQYKDKAVWEDKDGFNLTFTFSGKEVKVKSENYEEGTYGGFGVSFSGEYYKK